MDWFGYDDKGNWYTFWAPDSGGGDSGDDGSCLLWILGIVGVIFSGMFAYYYWPLVLGCFIASSVIIMVCHAMGMTRYVSLILWLVMSVVFVTVTIVRGEATFNMDGLGNMVETVFGVAGLIGEVFMARLFTMLPDWIAGKIFRGKK